MYNQNGSDLHSVVTGVTSKVEIAESFKNHFVKVSMPNSQNRVNQLNHEFLNEFSNATGSHTECNCSNYHVSLENVLDATFKLKKGKCADDTLICTKHFFNAPLALFDRLQCLFNKMLLHGFVPDEFQRGTIVPIVKDRHGDQGDLNNY